MNGKRLRIFQASTRALVENCSANAVHGSSTERLEIGDVAAIRAILPNDVHKLVAADLEDTKVNCSNCVLRPATHAYCEVPGRWQALGLAVK